MNAFKFFKEIDFEQFKRLYNRLTGREIHSGEEWSSFKDELVSWLILNQGLDIEALKTNFGFKDERGIYRFLKLPEIHELLLNRISIPTQIFTPRLLQKLSLCKSQVEKIETPILELKSVLSLYPVFEFIKHLTDEEMTILEPYTQKEVRDYFKGSTLQQVHSRLNELNFDEFEQTYQACFAGFGENILASIINRLQLHIFLTKGLVFKDHDSFLMCEFNDRHQSVRTSKRRCTIS